MTGKRLPTIMTLILLLYALVGASSGASAQSTEERFQDLFKTAGYSTAFGAAMGAAFLAFAEDPASRLKYVSVGASIGFISGSLFGSYIIFSPVFAEEGENPNDQLLLASESKSSEGSLSGIAIKPIISVEEKKFAGIAGSMTLLRF